MTIVEESSLTDGAVQPVRRLLRASALYGAAGVVGKAGALVTVPVVTRALGPAEYGILDLSTSMIGLATLVGGLSAELPTARLAADHREHRNALLTTYAVTVLAITALIAVFLIVAHDLVAAAVWNEPAAGPVVIAASGAIFLTSIQLATWNIHRLQDRPKSYAALSLIDIVLKASLIVAVAFADAQAADIVTVYLGVAGVGAVAGIWSVRSDLTRRILPWAIRPMIVSGAVFTVIAVSFIAAGFAVRSLLSGEAGQTAVGHMGVAVRLASALSLPLAAFQFAWAPPSIAASQSFASRRMFGQSTLGVLVIGGFAAVLVGGAATEAVTVLAGAEFEPAAAAVPGLAASTVLAAAFFMLGVGMSAARLSLLRAAMAAVAGAAIQFIVTAVALGPLGDLPAVGAASVVGHACAVLLALAAGRNRLVDDRALLVVGTAGITAAALSIQLMVMLDLTVLRWLVVGMSTLGLGVVVVRGFSMASRQDQ